MADRRNNHRFDLRLRIQCRRIDPPGRNIVCESLNISSTGLLFTTTEAFQPGQLVEAYIDWPMRLDDSVRLTLVVEGPVVWKENAQIAMRIDKYQFKTRGATEWRPDFKNLRSPPSRTASFLTNINAKSELHHRTARQRHLAGDDSGAALEEMPSRVLLHIGLV